MQFFIHALQDMRLVSLYNADIGMGIAEGVMFLYDIRNLNPNGTAKQNVREPVRDEWALQNYICLLSTFQHAGCKHLTQGTCWTALDSPTSLDEPLDDGLWRTRSCVGS